MKKEVKNTIVNYTVDNIDEITIVSVLQDKNLNHKELKVSINQENISIDNGTKGIGLFYDKNNNFQYKIENYYDKNNFEIKFIEYNAMNKPIQILVYENYENGNTKYKKEIDEEGNIIAEEFFDKDFWED